MTRGRFEFKKLSKYPHLKPEDVAVWERFIDLNPNFFVSVDYDYKVGKGQFIPEGTPENIAADMKGLSQKKADVIGYTENEIYIIEVKPEANMPALGQVLAYTNLFIKQENPKVKIIPTVICGKIMSDLTDIFSEFKVTIFVA